MTLWSSVYHRYRSAKIGMVLKNKQQWEEGRLKRSDKDEGLCAGGYQKFEDYQLVDVY